MYPVVVSDLDGTLLNDSHQVTARTRQVIQRLSEQGIKFVFATGRHYLDVEQIRRQLGIDMYLVTSNGARVHNPAGELVVGHDIAPDCVGQLIEIGRKYNHQAITSIYQGDSWFVEQEHEDMLAYHKESGFSYVKQPLDRVTVTGVQKVFFNTQIPEALEPLARELEACFGDQLSLTHSLSTCFEVMAPGVSKGVALTEVLRLKGYDAEQAIAFGDGMNDVDMLELVGKGIVMGSAGEKLRAKLPDNEVIGLSNDNAVANYLDALYQC